MPLKDGIQEPSVVAAILPLYLSGSILAGNGGHKDAPSLHDYFDSKEEAVRHYEYLKQIYQSISVQRDLFSLCIPLGKHRTHPFGNRSQNGIYHLDD